METELEVMKNNLNVWNSRVKKSKEQQQITKNYLFTTINNLQITKENHQKMEIFMTNACENPNFINQIMIQLENDQETNNKNVCIQGSILSSFPFMIINLKKAISRNPNPSFLYKLFDTVSNPDTNSIILWSKSGTSFFIKDTEGLHDRVQEIFKHNVKTFYKTLSDFGIQCVDKFLREYANDNFQRDNKHMLKKMKSKKILLAAKKILQSDMEEESKRLSFFLNSLKMNILKIKKKEQTTNYDLGHIKKCLQSTSNRILQEVKEQGKKKRRFEQYQSEITVQKGVQNFAERNGKRRPWLDPMNVGLNTEIKKLKHDLNTLNIEIQNLEQEQALIENQLAAIEEILPTTERKQQEIELSVNKLFMNPNNIPRSRSREKGKNKKVEGGIEKGNSKTNLESQSNNQKENDVFSGPDLEDDLMLWIGVLEEELSFS